MAFYDYHCQDCGHDFVIIESLHDHEEHKNAEPKCPECEGENVRRVITSVNVQTSRKF
jgi:putative FmdB family regulatory protein